MVRVISPFRTITTPNGVEVSQFRTRYFDSLTSLYLYQDDVVLYYRKDKFDPNVVLNFGVGLVLVDTHNGTRIQRLFSYYTEGDTYHKVRIPANYGIRKMMARAENYTKLSDLHDFSREHSQGEIDSFMENRTSRITVEELLKTFALIL